MRLLNIDEVSVMLGVSKATIYLWTSQNKIPHIKLSKRLLRFREADIISWIAQKSVNHIPDSLRAGRSKKSLNDDYIEKIIKDAKDAVLY